MNLRGLFISLTIICCVALTALSQSQSSTKPAPTPKPQKMKPETYSALFYSPSGAGPMMAGAGGTLNVTININAYSSDQEAQMLAKTLMDGGQDALRKQLEKMKGKGRVSLVGRVGQFELKLIRSRPMPEGGRMIIGVSDRPIRFLEAYYAGRSTGYDIGMLQIVLKPRDDKPEKEEGQGSLIYAARVKFEEGNKLNIETFGIEPARLMGVRRL